MAAESLHRLCCYRGAAGLLRGSVRLSRLAPNAIVVWNLLVNVPRRQATKCLALHAAYQNSQHNRRYLRWPMQERRSTRCRSRLIWCAFSSMRSCVSSYEVTASSRAVFMLVRTLILSSLSWCILLTYVARLMTAIAISFLGRSRRRSTWLMTMRMTTKSR